MADSESIEIKALPERILKVLTDVTTYPDWNKTVKEVHVLEQDEQGRPRQAQFLVNAVVKMLTYVIRIEYSTDTILYQMVSGNMKRNEGSYRVIPRLDGVTTLIYTFEQDPDVPIPAMLLRKGIKMGARQMLQDLKGLIEASPA